MDILIKSFSRPFYLDRCIRSIKLNVSGEYRIVVIDDGTSPRFLDHLTALHPEVHIKRTRSYEQKVQAIESHLSGTHRYSIASIPTQSWIDAVHVSSSHFLLLEEDAWLTAPTDLNVFTKEMQGQNLVTVKLFWGGHPLLSSPLYETSHPEIIGIKPALPSDSLPLLKTLVKNPFVSLTHFRKFGIIRPEHLIPYYRLYTVSSALFSKDYWLYVWAESGTRVNEYLQLLRAVEWFKLHPESKYGRTPAEIVNTSYASTSYSTLLRGFDVIRFNHFLSEKWLEGSLDIMDSYPGDLNTQLIVAALEKYPDLVHHWKRWVTAFKTQYRRQGFDIP